jgi:hypothetical protein
LRESLLSGELFVRPPAVTIPPAKFGAVEGVDQRSAGPPPIRLRPVGCGLTGMTRRRSPRQVPWAVLAFCVPTGFQKRRLALDVVRPMNSTLYRHLGAHVDVVDGIAGTRFAVWAPNAREVSVLCDQNSWMHGRDGLNSSDNGVWWGFIPGINAGDPYKFGIRTKTGISFRSPIPTPSSVRSRPSPPRSSTTSAATPGRTTAGSESAMRPTGTSSQLPFTRSISAPGKSRPTAGRTTPIANSRRCWWIT